MNSFVDALPAKDLFVDFLTKDLTLSRAITDLVDNNVDGARRLRPNGSLSDLYVRLKVAAEDFEITDNCGGIPLDLAGIMHLGSKIPLGWRQRHTRWASLVWA